jgi:hypothetical protein
MPFGLLHIDPLREVNIYKLTLSNGQLSYLSMIVTSHHLLAQDSYIAINENILH